MKITKEQIPESQVALQIEVDAERLEKAKNASYRRLASKVRIPGFRPGKAPRAVVERELGEHTILHEAIDTILPEVYREALEQEEIDPIDKAEYDLVTEDPLVVKFTVPVRPRPDLGDYGSLSVPREGVDVQVEQVEEELESLRHRYATLEPVSRPVQWQDIVRADVNSTADGSVLAKEDDVEFQLREDRPVSLPGFGEALIGREKGDSFEVEVTAPDDSPNEKLRGRQVRYQVAIKEVKEEILPELDDEFARQVGEGFDSLAALRTRIEDDLRSALEDEAEHRYHDQVLDALVEQAELEYPPVLLDRETDRLLEEQFGGAASVDRGRGGSRGRSREGAGALTREDLDRYLKQVGKSEEELREELRPAAVERIRRSLVLSELAEAEDIQVTDAEVDGEIDRMTSNTGNQADELRRLFSSDSAKESLRRSLQTRRTLERLAEIASTNGANAEADSPSEG